MWGNPEPCDNVDCGTHGSCQEDSYGDAFCSCDFGYEDNNLQCVHVCDGVDCSGHGICDVDSSGNGFCNCEAGFHNEEKDCIIDGASGSDELLLVNADECSQTGHCVYRFIFGQYYGFFTAADSVDYEIVINVKDPDDNWHNYWESVYDCSSDGKCTDVDDQYIDFVWDHEIPGEQYISVEVIDVWNDSAYDHLYHDLTDPCAGITCSGHGTCSIDGNFNPVCNCEEGYVNRNNTCVASPFQDYNLAQAVLEKLQQYGFDVQEEGDITQDQLEVIEHLDIEEWQVSSISGISAMNNLRVLNAAQNQITDITPLTSLSLLESLDISHNSVEDISEIANTTALKINLGHNPFPKNQLEILKSKAALQILLVSSFKINNPADRYDRYPGESIPDFIDRVLLERLCHLKRCDTSSGYIRCEFVSVDCYPGTCNEETDTCDCPSGFVEDSFIEVFWEFDPDIGCVLVDTGVECEDDEHLGDNNACMKNELKKSCDEEITLSDKQEWYSGKEKFTEIWNETAGAYEPVYNSSCFGKRADESCDPGNSENECLWRCIEGYTYDETDEECKPTATKEIWGSMINSFGRTQITRRDFAYEQHKDEIGFTPELFLSYGTNSEEWQPNIPYAKIGTNILTGYMFGGYLEELDFSAVSISLGTSIERYTNEFDTKYYQCWENEDAESNFLENYPNSECGITENEDEADWIVKKYYAEPGSRNYGYAELLYHKNRQKEPLQTSCIEEYKGCLDCLHDDGTPCEEHSDCQECLTDLNQKYYDTHIKILRHGSDGSKMVFKSTAPRASRKKNKPIPVRKIQTRTNREVSFDYNVSAKLSPNNFPYAIYDSVVITDSLERTIDVSLKNLKNDVDPESGLERLLPDNWQNQRSNLGLFGRESTHTGYKAEGAQLLTIKGVSDNHYVKYIIDRNSSSLFVYIYKDQELYRTDRYNSETNTVTIDVNKTERKERYFRCNENADWCDNNNEVGYKKITNIDSDTEKKEIVTINTKKHEKDTTPDNIYISFQKMRVPQEFITRKRELYENDELKKVIREEFSPWGLMMKRTVFS
ncbi:MAG: leucine-rich repeat domain-containing protein, partial [bacterium]